MRPSLRCPYLATKLIHIIQEKPLHSLFLSKLVADEFARGLPALRRVLALAMAHGACCPALAATHASITAQYSRKLVTSMEQAQLDYFGLHRYSRVDEPLSREDELKHQAHLRMEAPAPKVERKRRKVTFV
jgi:6-phosphogluconate dehydrogenase